MYLCHTQFYEGDFSMKAIKKLNMPEHKVSRCSLYNFKVLNKCYVNWNSFYWLCLLLMFLFIF